MENLLRRIFGTIGRVIVALLNVGIKIKYVLAVLVLFVGATAGITYSKMISNVGGKTDYNEAKRYIEIKRIVEEKYIDDVDSDKMTDSSSSAIVAGLGDRWSYYMSEDEYQAYQLYSSNEYDDIGMSMIKSDKGGFEIVSVNPGTPAGYSGVTVGMVITSIDGTDVTESDIDDVRMLIRSKMNTTFELGVGKDIYTVDCTGTYVSPVVSRLEKTGGGYIQIKSFEAGSGNDAVTAIEDLVYNQKAVALVIDLRSNAGGLSSEAAIVLDYLLPSGVLFSLVDKEGNKVDTKSDIMSLEIPMVILINTGTYAEAEVFAAVMKEEYPADKIRLMGEPTQGMTRIQETFELGDGSAVRLSTKSYLTASGQDIALAGGVIPDSIVYNEDPDSVGTTEGTLGESDGTASTSSDTQLMEALKYLS